MTRPQRPRAALAQLREQWRNASTEQQRAELAVLGAAVATVVEVLEAPDAPTGRSRERGQR